MTIIDKIKKINAGQNFKLYEYLGSHKSTKDGVKGVYFRVYAPNAKEIYVLGDFNDWDKTHPLKRIKESDVWEVFVEKAKNLQKYKYLVVDKNGNECEKADPFAFYGQNLSHDKDFSSYIYNLDYKWKDWKYLENLESKNHLESPMNIYEVCLLSWKRHSNGTFLSYREYATSLISYCKKMGYTHIELLPLSEYPYDISWGYQVSGYFSVTSRFGTPKDLMYFVDKCHKANIGVILDWVPGHFEIDDFALKEWDGTPLYESSKWDRQRQLAWGTRIFDYENPYVNSFLISSALFYLRKYHFDGLRVDAVSSILYLDFCRNADEWLPNAEGNNKNHAGEAFLKNLNNTVFGEFPNAIMVAEEVTGWPMVTRPTTVGGLGFNFKWNIGWMNDMWEYTSMDPYFRMYHHNILTHQLDYCFDENYILPIDHDEVGNGRHSLIAKMNGDVKTKVDLCRAFFVYMFMHPGKKLTFMGSEFGQNEEWSYKKAINFLLLKAERYKKLQKLVIELNKLYVNSPELYERDFDRSGFEWLVGDDNKNCVVAFKRYDKKGNYLICLSNFSSYDQDDYVLGVDEDGKYEEVLNSSNVEFGGKADDENEEIYSVVMNKHGKTNAIRVNLPANTTIILRKVK